jgi:pyruvate dehydrogenase (quinone)
VLVLNNGDLNMVTWEQRVLSGDPQFAQSQLLPDFRYADFAQSIGLAGVRVEHPEGLGRAWDSAFASDRPFVLEAVTDPDVPPLPPHLTWEQTKSFTSAMLAGDARRLGVLKQTAKEIAAGYLPKK